MRKERAIVRDYNGHLRIDQADLDAVEMLEELRETIFQKDKEIEAMFA